MSKRKEIIRIIQVLCPTCNGTCVTTGGVCTTCNSTGEVDRRVVELVQDEARVEAR